MTTQDLVESVLNYPLFNDMNFYQTPQAGFDAVARSFNGMQELLERPDGGLALLDAYESQSTEVNPSDSATDRGMKAWQVSKLEMLLTQEPLLQTLDASHLAILHSEAQEKVQEKRASSHTYGATGESETIRLLSAVMKHRGKLSRSSLAKFTRTGRLHTIAQLNRARRAVGVSLEGAPTLRRRDYASSVRTPNGSSVAATYVTTELTSAQKTTINSQTDSAYPAATRLRGATKKYNCHSYAWHSQATGNSFWINQPNQAKYWNDGSYRLDYNVGHANARVRYVNDDHSAFAQNDSWYVSKWGQAGLYQHPSNYAPYAPGVRYYRR